MVGVDEYVTVKMSPRSNLNMPAVSPVVIADPVLRVIVIADTVPPDTTTSPDCELTYSVSV